MGGFEQDVLASINVDNIHLTRRQAEVWALRAKGYTQSKIADEWGTSRANVCMLERAARRKIEKSRETALFDEQVHAPLQLACHPGELLLDIPPRLYRAADQAEIKVRADGPMVIQHILNHAHDCVRDNRFVKPILLIVTTKGNVLVRPSAPPQPAR